VRGGEELDDLDRHFAGLPSILLPPPSLTGEQAAGLENRFRAAMSNPRYRYFYRGRWRYALPLPWYTRLRLWCAKRIDGMATWLLDHDRERAAVAVWRITGHWLATGPEAP